MRREATFDDYRRFTKLAQVYDDFDTAGGLVVEPNDLPLDSRHLDMQLALLTLTDKPYGGSQVSLTGALDSLAMAGMAFGGADALAREPALYTVVNANSPLLYDGRMLDSLLAYAAAGQPAIITPFLLMGAMSPVSIPSALVQQTAEALAGVALAQLVRPGTPVVLGSFLSHTDMQSGSPGFGGPESAIGLLASGQIARRLGLPWRSGGGSLTSSQVPDAQAAYEGLNTMLPAFLAGANFVMHTAGWLESGLVSCYEKFVVDLEIVRTLREEFTPLEVDEASLAYGAHQEVGHGGHFLGAEHTLERFRDVLLPAAALEHRELRALGAQRRLRQRRARDDRLARGARALRATAHRLRSARAAGGVRHPAAERARGLAGKHGVGDLRHALHVRVGRDRHRCVRLDAQVRRAQLRPLLDGGTPGVGIAFLRGQPDLDAELLARTPGGIRRRVQAVAHVDELAHSLGAPSRAARGSGPSPTRRPCGSPPVPCRPARSGCPGWPAG